MNIVDMLRRPLSERKELCGFKTLNKIKIDGNEISGFKAFSFFYEKQYSTNEIKRSKSGVLNLEGVGFFLTPHLKINFSLISFDDYKRIAQLSNSKSEFIVECHDIIYDNYNETSTFKMYFAPDSLPNLYLIPRALQGEKWVEVLGAKDYTVELIGTNNELDSASVTYHLNPPQDTGLPDRTEGSQNYALGADFIVGSDISFPNETFNGKYIFKGWNTITDGNGQYYVNGQAYTLNNKHGLTLFAVWESATMFTLSYSYGIGAPKLDSTGKTITDKKVSQNQPIGLLPTSPELPTVSYNSQTYRPYKNPRWYKTSVKTPNSVPLTENDLYWIKGNAIIYQLYDTEEYTLNFNSNGGTVFDSIRARYNVQVALPTPVKDGKKFVAWYKDSGFTQPFSGVMPPFSITLYAKWEG